MSLMKSVEGQTSGATARVKEWNATTNKLEISGISSNFHNGEQIIGQNSGAKFAIFSVNTDDEVSGFAENDVIQSEADSYYRLYRNRIHLECPKIKSLNSTVLV